MNDVNELYHYGTPRHSGRYPYGSGKRPYQGEKHDVIPLNEYRDKEHKLQYKNSGNDIYKSLSDKEKVYLSGDMHDNWHPEDIDITNDRDAERIYSDIVSIKDIPVGFILMDRHDDGSTTIAIAVRNDEEYRKIGIASRMYQRGEKAVKSFNEKGLLDVPINTLTWAAYPENYKSIATAIKNGFEDKGVNVYNYGRDVQYEQKVKEIQNSKEIRESAKASLLDKGQYSKKNLNAEINRRIQDSIDDLNPYRLLRKEIK